MMAEKGRGTKEEEGGENPSLLFMMKTAIISWNVRGIGRVDLRKQACLQKILEIDQKGFQRLFRYESAVQVGVPI